MNRISVSDAAVEAAMIAGENFASENTVSMYASVRDLMREEMRAAIEAALPELLERVAYMEPETLNSAEPVIFEDCAAKWPNDYIGWFPVYRLRHPTPGREGQDNG